MRGAVYGHEVPDPRGPESKQEVVVRGGTCRNLRGGGGWGIVSQPKFFHTSEFIRDEWNKEVNI